MILGSADWKAAQFRLQLGLGDFLTVHRGHHLTGGLAAAHQFLDRSAARKRQACRDRKLPT